MRVLMITEKDAANATLSKIADELIRRNNSIEIYAVYNAKNVLRYFDTQIPVYDFANLSVEICETFDCILTSSVIAVSLQSGDIISARVPIFTQNYLVNGQVYWRGDVCFVASLETSETEYTRYMRGGRVAIGEPKYDSVKTDIMDSKKLLFLDSGHFPFGMEGRTAVADTILKIAQAYPEYELVVKPRFLPEDTVVTHKNRIHLYDVIKERAGGVLPKNLTLLNEHLDLEQLIEESYTVICMYTTAFVGACVNKKGLVVLDDIPSIDVYDTRYKTSLRIRKYMEKSGAVINYKDVLSVLPHGVVADDEYIEYLLAERGSSANHISEKMEYLVENFYSKGLFPEITDVSDSKFNEFPVRENWTWEKQIDLRYRDYLIQRLAIHIDFHVKAKLNVNSVLEGFLPDELIDLDKYKELLPQAFTLRNRCIIENRDEMMHDEIDQGILLNALYLMGRYEEIHSFPNKKIGAYHYFNALVYEKENNIGKCIEHLRKYDEISYGRDYILEVSDMPNNRFAAYALLVKVLVDVQDKELASQYLKKLEQIYLDNYMVNSLSDECKTKGQYRHLTMLLWAKATLENNLLQIEHNENLYIYGAGEICNSMILNNDQMRKNVDYIIDKYTSKKEIEGIQILKWEDIGCLESGIMIITIPEQAKEIKKEIEKKNTKLKCISILDYFLWRNDNTNRENSCGC